MTSPYVPRVSAVDVGATRLLARMELGEYCQRTHIATRIPLLLQIVLPDHTLHFCMVIPHDCMVKANI
jgi:hypothetical protein